MLAGIVQCCPGLAVGWCQAQVTYRPDCFTGDLVVQNNSGLELLNNILEITNYTGLSIQVAQAMQGFHGTTQAGRQGGR